MPRGCPRVSNWRFLTEGMIRIYIFSSNLPPCLYPGLMLEKGAFANFAEEKEYKPGGTVQKSDVNF